jgi:F-type H+-transporting ATPase subunit b
MPPGEREAIQNALNETFSAEIRVRFETAPTIISGIELTVSGQKLAWSIAEYLTQLEQKLGSLLDTQALSRPQTPSATTAAAAAGA